MLRIFISKSLSSKKKKAQLLLDVSTKETKELLELDLTKFVNLEDIDGSTIKYNFFKKTV
jgi:hypothetical protein